MNSKYTWLITAATAIGSIFSALALHGKAAVEALAGVPILLEAWASGLPLGIWSFLLSLVLATLVWSKLIVTLPVSRDGRRPHFSADTVAVLIAVTITVTQQWFAGATVGQGKLLNAIWLGGAAGLIGTYLGRAAQALLARKPAAPPDPPISPSP